MWHRERFSNERMTDMEFRFSRRKMMQGVGGAALAQSLATADAAPAPRKWPIEEGPDTPKICLSMGDGGGPLPASLQPPAPSAAAPGAAGAGAGGAGGGGGGGGGGGWWVRGGVRRIPPPKTEPRAAPPRAPRRCGWTRRPRRFRRQYRGRLSAHT